jgi:cytochrome c553
LRTDYFEASSSAFSAGQCRDCCRYGLCAETPRLPPEVAIFDPLFAFRLTRAKQNVMSKGQFPWSRQNCSVRYSSRKEKDFMRTRNKFRVTVLLLAALVATVSKADVQENWAKNCASCHGKDGKGQTKAGKMADVKDLTDAPYQAAFTDEEAFTRVKEGLKDKNGKDRMKPFAEKLKDDEIKELVAHIRAFKK